MISLALALSCTSIEAILGLPTFSIYLISIEFTIPEIFVEVYSGLKRIILLHLSVVNFNDNGTLIGV